MSSVWIFLASLAVHPGHRSRLLLQHPPQSSALQELGVCCPVVLLPFPIEVVSCRLLGKSQHFIFNMHDLRIRTTDIEPISERSRRCLRGRDWSHRARSRRFSNRKMR